MGKKLITPQNAVEYICGDKFYVGKDMILSSSAKDYFKEKMITLVYGEEKPVEDKKCCKEQNKEDLKTMIVKVLERDFNICDEKLVDIILKKVEGVRK